MTRLELNLNRYRLLGCMTPRYVTSSTVLLVDQLQMGSVSVPYPVVSLCEPWVGLSRDYRAVVWTSPSI